MKKKYSVEEVAERFGITSRTLHYYEEIGLLTEVPRTEGGHRYYNDKIIEKLEHIIRLKDGMGISLQEIRTLMDLERRLEDIREGYRQESQPSGKIQFLVEGEPLLEELIVRMTSRIEQLEELRTGFKQRLERVKLLQQQSENDR